MKYVVYTDIVGEGRWYYGTYDYERANEVALELGAEYPVYHCVCPITDAEMLGIQNMPY